MNPRKLGLGAVAVLAAGAIIGGGAALASADPTPSTSASSSAGADANSGTAGAGQGQEGPAMHTHTAASAEETQKVTDAVKAKDSTVSITTVEKDPDGSFDARGTTSDGSPVMFEVSADYATVSQGHGGRGGPGGASQDTPVTGDEAQKVIDAVKAKDSTVTIDNVRKDPDGSYDALGAKSDGTKVMFDVSTDLATITEGQGGPGGPGGRGGHGPDGGSATSGTSGSTSSPSSANG